MTRINHVCDVRGSDHDYDVYEVYYVCPECGSEIFGKWLLSSYERESSKVKEALEDFIEFCNGSCPLCENNLRKNIGYYFARKGSNESWYDDLSIWYDDDCTDNYDDYDYINNYDDYDYYDDNTFKFCRSYGLGDDPFTKEFINEYVPFAEIWKYRYADNRFYLSKDNDHFDRFLEYGFEDTNYKDYIFYFYFDDYETRKAKEKHFYPWSYDYVPADVIFDLLKEFRKKDDIEYGRYNYKTNSILSEKHANEKYSVEKIKSIKNNPESLRDFIKCLIDLESGVYFLSENLTNLYFYQAEENKIARGAKLVEQKNFKDEIKFKEKNLDLQMNSLIDAIDDREIKREDIEQEFRKNIKNEKPVFNKTKPVEPRYKLPGLFNWKRVQKENIALEKKYNDELTRYNDKEQEYLSRLKNYEDEEIKLNTMIDEEYNNRVKLQKEKVELQKKEVNEKVNSLKEQFKIEEEQLLSKIEECESSDVSTPTKEFVDKHVDETEKLLRSLVMAKNNLYSAGIVYGKYHDVVILSSFYEYLLSGRCSTLEGPNGAYNIYEQELRADMIISELNTVINSLEEIKKNQYMIYSELKYVKSGLDMLNKSFELALNALDQANENLSEISEIDQVIAYNTEATAYYSELNTQLTNALGFLVALK